MSVATPTLIPRPEDFPHLLPKPPQPHPTPLPKAGGPSVRFNVRRNLQREMDDLSDEENELEDLNLIIRNRGYNFLVPMGRTLTQQEEKNDADDDDDDEDDDETDSGQSGLNAPSASVGENESNIDGDGDSGEVDLDASMEDMDDADGSADVTAETEDYAGEEEFEDAPSFIDMST